MLGMLAHGSRGSSWPSCSSSTEMPSGVLTNAMCPSRGGRLIVTPASMQPLAGRVDVVDPVGEMAEVAPAGVVLARSQLWVSSTSATPSCPGAARKIRVKRPCSLSKRRDFLEPDQLEEADRRLGIADADHGVEISGHRRFLGTRAPLSTPSACHEKARPGTTGAGPILVSEAPGLEAGGQRNHADGLRRAVVIFRSRPRRGPQPLTRSRCPRG